MYYVIYTVFCNSLWFSAFHGVVLLVSKIDGLASGAAARDHSQPATSQGWNVVTTATGGLQKAC